VTGKYFSNRKETSAPKISYDPIALQRLWEISADLTNLEVTA
jgi:hypothetical protein